MSSQTATDSICPSGWRLPTDISTTSLNANNIKQSEFSNLLYSYGIMVGNNPSGSYGNEGFTNADTPLLSFPLSFLRSGYYLYSNGGLGGRGSRGTFWSSFASSPAHSRSLYFGSTYLSPQNDYNKGNGFAVRCVAR